MTDTTTTNTVTDGRMVGLYLTLMSRTSCRACFIAGIRNGEQKVVSDAELREFSDAHHGQPMAQTSVGRRILGRRGRAHYATQHPEIALR